MVLVEQAERPLRRSRQRRRRIIYDLESNGLLDTLDRIHILAIRDIDTRETFVFRHNDEMDNIEEGLDIINEAELRVGLNNCTFDDKALYKVYGDKFAPTGKVRDCLVMSRVLFADIKDRDFRLAARGILEGKLIGRHSLKAWGQRLDLHKGDYAETKAAELKALYPDLPKEEINNLVWAEWSPEMESYGVGDIDVTEALWSKISQITWSEESIILEHQIHELMDRVSGNGFLFDIERARALEEELREQHVAKSAIAIEHFGSWWAPKKWLKTGKSKSYLNGDGIAQKDALPFRPRAEFGEDEARANWGEVFIPKRDAHFTDWLAKGADKVAGAAYCPIQLKEFNPNSRPQIIERLITIHEWEPQDFTEKGNPTIDDDVLRDLAKTVPIAQELAEIFYYQKRLGQLVDGANGWLALVGEDGFIHPNYNVGGTVTNRMSHSRPNIGQVPAVKTRKEALLDSVSGAAILGDDGTPKKRTIILKGREGDHGWDCRELFIAPPGWILMGADQQGIELRALAHYMWAFDEGEYARIVLEADPHDLHMSVLELTDRDLAKRFLYACVPMDTTVLTRKGWKNHDELILGEDIMSYNAETGLKEWTPLLEVVCYDSAPVVKMEHGHSFSVRCTPNHRWFVKRRSGGRNERYYVDEVRTTEELNSECNIIVNAPFNVDQDRESGGSGWLNGRAKYETDWVTAVLRMSHAERETFLAGFLIADGFSAQINGRRPVWKWGQNCGELSEAALLASYLVGQGFVAANRYLRPNSRDHENQYMTGSLSLRGHVTSQRMITTPDGEEPVFCVRTKNESFVMRQGDVITITGNTLYGAGPYKQGITLDPTLALRVGAAKKLGTEMNSRLMTRIPAFGQLVKSIKKECRGGYVTALDGRKLFTRSQHAALNTKLQGCGATLAKKWVILFEQYMEDEGYIHGWNGDFAIVAVVHDEMQIALRDDNPKLKMDAQRLVKQAAADAGTHFGFKLPVDVSVKFGFRWSETH